MEPPTNGQLGDLLWEAARSEGTPHRRRALERASRAARWWPQEARDVAASGASLTSLHGVGPWVGAAIERWLQDPPAITEPEESRQGFLTWSEVVAALEDAPAWTRDPVADLQVHTTETDGSLPLAEMVEAARRRGRPYIAITDHSQSLTITNGMDPERLAAQGRAIDALNETYRSEGAAFRVLRAIEMDVLPDGEPDMPADSLAGLDLVLGAMHSNLRAKEDQTERYVIALRHPSIHVLAHPTARMYGRRTGIRADWARVFAEAAAQGVAVELDATPARQDLRVEHARLAVREGAQWFSIGSDAHADEELDHLAFGLAIAVLAGVPPERIINLRPVDEVIAWAEELRGRA